MNENAFDRLLADLSACFRALLNDPQKSERVENRVSKVLLLLIVLGGLTGFAVPEAWLVPVFAFLLLLGLHRRWGPPRKKP